MTGPAKQRYVAACAAITAASQLLVAAHAAAGAPRRAADDKELALRSAIAQARTAAGAMAVVAGRLLTQVREDEARLLPRLAPPVRAEEGVTTPGPLADADWRTTVRALAAAAEECHAAERALAAAGAPTDVQGPVADLLRIGDVMAELLSHPA